MSVDTTIDLARAAGDPAATVDIDATVDLTTGRVLTSEHARRTRIRFRRRRVNTDVRAARLVPVLLALGMAGSWWAGHLLRVW